MELVIITGMSGAGKSQAIKALEDIGYYCVDNLPPALMHKFAELCRQSAGTIRRVALVTDVRSGPMFEELLGSIDAVRQTGLTCKLLFLDCDDTTLLRRYKETRRLHPLTEPGGRVEEALLRERQLLDPVARCCDYRIDTTQLTANQLKSTVKGIFREEQEVPLTVECMSFGFKYGFPAEADLMLDVRCFPNPFYVPALKPLTGLDAAVRDYVLRPEETQGFLTRLYDMTDYLIPLYVNEGKSQLVIAIGCTGGQHRSVAIAEALAAHLRKAGQRVLVTHRDMEK